MKRALIVGGANGIGIGLATVLSEREETEKIYIFDKCEISPENDNPKFEYHRFDLTSDDFSVFDRFQDIDTLIITAGIGRLSLFKDVEESLIPLTFQINTISAIRIIKHYYDKLESEENFYCGVMVSISGFMSSPFFSVYAASKAALKVFIESVNVELMKSGSNNRILNVSPGSIKGTSFNNEKTKIELIKPLAVDIINELEKKNDLYIPQYEEVFKHVLARYQADFRAEGAHSYDYKKESERMRQASAGK